MTALALVLLVLGFLFATLQYPAAMRRFWKWALIGGGLLVLISVCFVIVAAEIDTHPNTDWWNLSGQAFFWLCWAGMCWWLFTVSNRAVRVLAGILTILGVFTLGAAVMKHKPNPFDQFDGKPNDWVSPEQAAQHGPWEDYAGQKGSTELPKGFTPIKPIRDRLPAR